MADSSENTKVLKKLNFTEMVLAIEMSHKKAIFAHAFLVKSKFDLISNTDAVDKAINYWKRLHPLLCSKIEPVDCELSFVRCDSGNDTNVEYLYFNGDNEKMNQDERIWRFIYEKEYLQPLDDLLWRLKILRLTKDKNSDGYYNYCFILTIHHSMSDGRNAYAIIIELCSFIELAFKNQLTTDVSEKEVELMKREYFYENDPRTPDVKDVDEDVVASSFKTVTIAGSMMPDGNKNENDFTDLASIPIRGTYFTSKGTVYATFDSILQSLKTTFTGNRLIKFDSVGFKKLVDKAKAHDVKLTSCLALINAIALIRVFNRFSVDNLEASYSVPVNCRQFLKPPIENRVCGNWMNRLAVKIKIYENEADFWTAKFWKLSKEQSDDFHKRLQNGEHFDGFKFIAIAVKLLFSGQLPKGCLAYFTFSNIGVMESSLNNSETIKVNEHYSGLSFGEGSINMMYTQHSLTTIDDNLYWTITYGTKFTKKEVVDYWSKSIVDVYNQVLEN